MSKRNLDLVEQTLDDVGRRTASLARHKGRLELATKPDDKDLLRTFCDDAIFKILTITGVIRSAGTDAETTTDATTGEETETGYYLNDYVDPDTNMDELVPVELWPALTYAVMAEWFTTIGEGGVAGDFEGKFKSEMALYRFSPNTPVKAERPYRPF